MSEIVRLINQIQKTPDANVSLGHGPKHPTEPDESKAPILAGYWQKFPFLLQDQGYVDYMEMYCGLLVYRPNDEVVIDVFGFSEVSTPIEVIDGEFLWIGESNIVVDGYLVFCEALYVILDSIVDKAESNYERISANFAFDATGERQVGIYKTVSKSSKENSYDPGWYWYCQTFAQWLEMLVKYKGNFPELL